MTSQVLIPGWMLFEQASHAGNVGGMCRLSFPSDEPTQQMTIPPQTVVADIESIVEAAITMMLRAKHAPLHTRRALVANGVPPPADMMGERAAWASAPRKAVDVNIPNTEQSQT